MQLKVGSILSGAIYDNFSWNNKHHSQIPIYENVRPIMSLLDITSWPLLASSSHMSSRLWPRWSVPRSHQPKKLTSSLVSHVNPYMTWDVLIWDIHMMIYTNPWQVLKQYSIRYMVLISYFKQTMKTLNRKTKKSYSIMVIRDVCRLYELKSS